MDSICCANVLGTCSYNDYCLTSAFIVIGPVMTGVGAVMSGIYHFSPIIAGLLMGGLWQVLVIFGVHWGIVAVATADMAVMTQF